MNLALHYVAWALHYFPEMALFGQKLHYLVAWHHIYWECNDICLAIDYILSGMAPFRRQSAITLPQGRRRSGTATGAPIALFREVHCHWRPELRGGVMCRRARRNNWFMNVRMVKWICEYMFQRASTWTFCNIQ
jgi:hypothetical protein